MAQTAKTKKARIAENRTVEKWTRARGIYKAYRHNRTMFRRI